VSHAAGVPFADVTTPLRLLLSLVLSLLAACSKPQPVQVTPRTAQISWLAPTGVGVAISLDVHNPNEFSITASDVNGVFELKDGTELGRGTATTAFTVPGGATVPLGAELRMSWTNLAAFGPYALSLQPLPYRIRGRARVGGKDLRLELPFSIEGQLTPEQVIQATLQSTGAGRAP
jgi:LEA14-like dessication related protein